MRKLGWRAYLGLSLVALSVVAYALHFAFFRDAHHIFIYLLGDVAFVPIEVLLVTLILHELLSRREKKGRLNKLNMVIGAFFSEVGTDLLSMLSAFDERFERVCGELRIDADWPGRRFAQVGRRLAENAHATDARRGDLEELRKFLIAKRPFLLALLENPNLLEHEAFTDLLSAVFHLTEELEKRSLPAELPEADYQHLSGDIRRAYGLLMSQWLAYMRHLKADYPYLFSLATRTNPFDPAASVVVG